MNASKLPYHEGKIPLVVRTMRTNLILPNNYPALQILVSEKGTYTLDTEQLATLLVNGQIDVLRGGRTVIPKNGEFQLTFHPLIKRYWPSPRVLSPQENTEQYFKTIDTSKINEPSIGQIIAYGWRSNVLLGASFSEMCFYLGATLETMRIDNKHLGMLTHSYPHKWRRTVYRISPRTHRRTPVEAWVEPSGYVHLTPWIKPGSYGNQVLEIASKRYSQQEVSIEPRAESCSLRIFELDEECEAYNGRYIGQDGPLVSLLYNQ